MRKRERKRERDTHLFRQEISWSGGDQPTRLWQSRRNDFVPAVTVTKNKNLRELLLLKRKYNDYQSKITLKKTKIKKIEPGVGSRQGKKNTRFDKRVRMMTTLTIYYYYYYIDSTVSLRIYFFLLFLARIIYPLCLRKCIQFRINFPRVLAHTI